MIISKLFLEIILPNFPKYFEIFWYFSRKLYEICFENFLENLKKIRFWIIIYTHFRLKLKNLWVTVPYKRNRSNTENIKCRLVMSLLIRYIRSFSGPDPLVDTFSWRTVKTNNKNESSLPKNPFPDIFLPWIR